MGDMYDEDFIPTHPDIETRMEAVELYSKLATQLSEAAVRCNTQRAVASSVLFVAKADGQK